MPLATAQEPSHDEMMAKWMEAAQPGAPHKLLAKMAGTWQATVKSWQDPTQPPQVSQGTSDSELIMDGRFLKTKYEGEMMGMPMHGIAYLGYDNLKQEYCGIWMDNMSTSIMYYAGSFDKDQGKLTCHGDGIDPMSGQTYTSRMVTKFVSDNEHVWEMYSPGPDGKEVKWVEITYVRK
jgi:hypothetical protein